MPTVQTGFPITNVARRAVRKVGRVTLERIAQASGYTLAPRHYSGPVPISAELPDKVWTAPSQLRGIDLSPRQHLEFLEGELAPYIAEFSPPYEQSPHRNTFFLDNGTYGSVDAEVLYAMVRRARPRQVLELGSGASSLVIDKALERNEIDGAPSEYVIIDPFPGSVSTFGKEVIGRRAALEPVSVVDIPLERFKTLTSGDILFVDTSHTVKTGGDVNFVILDVLPSLAPGVLVHFHDIFLPWDYPRDWIEIFWQYWAEQYLLQAFLAFNDEYEILIATHAVARRFPDRLATSVPSFAASRSSGGQESRGRMARARRAAALASSPTTGFRDRWGSALAAAVRPPRPSAPPRALWLRRTAETC